MALIRCAPPLNPPFTRCAISPVHASARSEVAVEKPSVGTRLLASPSPAVPKLPAVVSSPYSFETSEEKTNTAIPSAAAEAVTKDGVEEMGMQVTPLESTWEHRLWIAVGSAAISGLLLKAGLLTESPLATAAAIAAGYLTADLVTGIYHWGVDNYGDARTPVFGPQIDAFQGHHRRPWTITKRQVANNLHALARPATFAISPFILASGDLIPSYVDAYVASLTAFVVLSQQFHAWAHTKRSELPGLVLGLQGAGLLVTPKMHGAHHRAPFDRNYCIVSGVWNPVLDSTRFFHGLERFIFAKWGVAPRCWCEEEQAEWQQEGSYFSDGTDVDHTSS